MTNHVHMIISRGSEILLEGIMRDMKKFTAFKILEAIKKEPESRREWMINLFSKAGLSNSNNTTYQFWLVATNRQDYHPLECINNAMLVQKVDYLHEMSIKRAIPTEDEYLWKNH